jgi:hypothetical protein
VRDEDKQQQCRPGEKGTGGGEDGKCQGQVDEARPHTPSVSARGGRPSQRQHVQEDQPAVQGHQSGQANATLDLDGSKGGSNGDRRCKCAMPPRHKPVPGVLPRSWCGLHGAALRAGAGVH